VAVEAGAVLRRARQIVGGWAWGPQYLKGSVAVAEARVGNGKLVLIRPLVAFRAYPHGTFKLLFNRIYFGSAAPVRF
jgi:hypothetical protein